MTANEPKSVRLPLMVTEAELATIDDFRFRGRLPSRAEAVRRLIELGLAAAVNSRAETTKSDQVDGRKGRDAGRIRFHPERWKVLLFDRPRERRRRALCGSPRQSADLGAG